MNNKGAMMGLDSVPRVAIVFVVIAIVLANGATILTQVQSTQTANSLAYNITGQGLQAQSTLSSWQNIWVVIAAASIVLALIGGFLYFRG